MKPLRFIDPTLISGLFLGLLLGWTIRELRYDATHQSRKDFDNGVLCGCLEGVKLYKSYQGSFPTNVIPELFKNVRATPDLPERYK